MIEEGCAVQLPESRVAKYPTALQNVVRAVRGEVFAVLESSKKAHVRWILPNQTRVNTFEDVDALEEADGICHHKVKPGPEFVTINMEHMKQHENP